MKKHKNIVSVLLFSAILTICGCETKNNVLKKPLRKNTNIDYSAILPDDYSIDSFLIESNDFEKNYTEKDFDDIGALYIQELYPGKNRLFEIGTEKKNKQQIISSINSLLKRDDIEIAEPNQNIVWFSSPSNYDGGNGTWYVGNSSFDKAWDIKMSSTIPVGIMDTGIDSSCTELSGRVNSSLSVSYSPNSSNALQPAIYHGTQVAGLIGAIGNNNILSFGINWKSANLVSLRVDGEAGGFIANGFSYPGYQEKMSCVISAMNYVNSLSTSIPIINFSGGFVYTSTSLYNCISNYNGLLVCAAGNVDSSQNISNQQTTIYPAWYNLPNTITVTAINSSNSILSDACYNNSYVHLAAPGTNIRVLSTNNTYTNNGYGTSFSAPLVAATAALLKTANPYLTASEMKSAIVNNVDSVGLGSYCVSGGKLNSFKSLLSVIPEYYIVYPVDEFTYYNNAVIPPYENHWFKINIVNPGTYKFETTGYMNSIGTLYGSDGATYITSASTGGTDNNFAFTRSFASAGTYYLKITNNGSSVSTYTVKVTNCSYLNGENYHEECLD